MTVPPATAASLSHGIPADARERLAAMVSAGVQTLAFTPDGGWLIVGTPGGADSGYAARGIPDACFVKLGEFIRAGHAIRSVAFAPGSPGNTGGWVIVSDRAYFAHDIPDDCFEALVDAWAQGLRPSCIAFTPAGKGWAMLAGKAPRCSGIDAACAQQMTNFAQGLRPAQQVAFAPNGGWVLLARDRFAAQGLDAACLAHLGQVTQANDVEHIAFAPNGGWVVGSNTPRSELPADPLREVEDRFRLVNGRWRSLTERMTAHGVSGVSMALRVDGELVALTEQGALAAAPEMRVFEQGRCSFTVGTEGGAAAALADEIEEALRRVYREPDAKARLTR